MAALSLMSTAAEKPAAGQVGAAGFSPHAPSVRLPMRFMLAGMTALVAGVICLIVRPDILATYHYNQYVIATTHLFVLGWISSVVIGAMYQLVPVALETRLHSERMARWHFLVHVVGVAGMVWMFWKWDMKQVAHFGSAYAAGVGLFVYNIGRTLLRVPRWNVVASAVLSAMLWLCVTIAAGLAIAAGKCTYESAASLPPTHPWGAVIHSLQSIGRFATRFDQIAAMHAHAHLGAVGVFVMMIVGISYKLLPMFTLSEVQQPWRARASVLMLNFGLAGAVVTIALRSPWKIAFSLLIIAGLAIYGVEVAAILRARKRRTLDWGLRYFLTALVLLGPLVVLAGVLSWPGLPLTVFTGQLENLYGFIAIVGVISLAIIGMLYKILPFLVWYGTYSKHIGRTRVPSLGDLYSSRLQLVAYWTYLAGVTLGGTGVVFSSPMATRSGAVLLLLSLSFLLVNVGLILSHIVRPRLQAVGSGLGPQAVRPTSSTGTVNRFDLFAKTP